MQIGEYSSTHNNTNMTFLSIFFCQESGAIFFGTTMKRGAHIHGNGVNICVFFVHFTDHPSVIYVSCPLWEAAGATIRAVAGHSKSAALITGDR